MHESKMAVLVLKTTPAFPSSCHDLHSIYMTLVNTGGMHGCSNANVKGKIGTKITPSVDMMIKIA